MPSMCFSYEDGMPRQMPFPCFSYPADVPPDTRKRDPRSIGYPCFSYPKICFSYPDDVTPGTGGSRAVQPPPDSKLCFSYVTSHCFRC